jgi:uncharacterized protein YggE
MEVVMAAARRRVRVATRIASRSCLFGAVAFAAAWSVAPACGQAPPQSPPEAGIVVSGEGSVGVVPDYATIRAGVTTRAKTANEATDANAKLMAAVIAALVNAGIARNDIQTTQFSLQPTYAMPQPGGEQKLTGFSASNEVNVKIRQLGSVGEMLDRLINAGATEVGNMSFLHSDPAKALDQAREAAVADARRKAELYAHAAGLTLGAVAWITEDSGAAPPIAMRALRASAAMSVPAPILSGEDTLRVQITVGFAVAR